MVSSGAAGGAFPKMATSDEGSDLVSVGIDWPLLRSLPEEDRRRVLSAARRRRFARREVIFHEGDLGDTLHLIAKGRVAIRIMTPLGDIATISVLGQGDVVGEMAVLEEDGRRGATALALEATETLSIDRRQFAELRRQQPAIDRFIIDVLAAHVRRVDVQLMEALFMPVERRLIRRLLALTDVYGHGHGPDVVDVPLTQDDLASLAGTSRATVNRVLRQAEEAGMVSLSRGHVRVVDRELLAKRAR